MDGGEGFGSEGCDGGWDLLEKLLNAGAEVVDSDTGGGEFGVAAAFVGDGRDLTADVFAEIAFQVKHEIAGGIGDAGQGTPERGGVREGVELLKKTREVAAEEFGDVV